LEASITSFCTTYGIDSSRCAEELSTFAPSFSKFNRFFLFFPKKERKEGFHRMSMSLILKKNYIMMRTIMMIQIMMKNQTKKPPMMQNGTKMYHLFLRP
jgi:hypothetical protein